MPVGRPKKNIIVNYEKSDYLVKIDELNKKIDALEQKTVYLQERLNTYASEGIGIGSLYEFRDIVFDKFKKLNI
jgi:hypothetical protein